MTGVTRMCWDVYTFSALLYACALFERAKTPLGAGGTVLLRLSANLWVGLHEQLFEGFRLSDTVISSSPLRIHFGGITRGAARNSGSVTGTRYRLSAVIPQTREAVVTRGCVGMTGYGE